MVQDVRSSGGTFDFNSQSGVLRVLQAIRVSNISLGERNELRDLVFLYANGGGDAAVRTLLQDRLTSLGITPDSIPPAPNSKKATAIPSGFSGGRPQPQFVTTHAYVPTVPAAVSITEPVPATASDNVSTEVPVKITPQIPVVSVADIPVVSEVVPPVVNVSETPIVSRIEPVVTPTVGVQAVFSASVPKPAIPTPSPQIDVSAEVVVTPQPVAPKVTSEPSAASATSHLDRIRDIKADINAKVGNPVNLVDIDNTIGHEYMTALLDAMKQIGNGASEHDVARAMQRLESVYTKVVSLIATRSGDVASDTISPVAPPIVPVITAEVPSVSVPTPAPSAPVPSPEMPVSSAAAPKSSLFAPVQAPVAESLPIPTAPAPVVTESAPVVLTKNPQQQPHEEVSRPKIVVRPPVSAEPNIVMPITHPGDAVAVPISSTRHNFSQSVAAAAPLKTPADLPTAADVRTNSAADGHDPLFTKEIDDGLEQLLSEWSLFKKSGLFGTGPKGAAHPLYKKLAALQIPLILSGRFEGATQEIRQSITDYMNGWRYEQGIIYEKDETFERYLRRVIRHIIDWQNKPTNA